MRYLTATVALLMFAAGAQALENTISIKADNDEGGISMDSDGCYIEVGSRVNAVTHDTWCLIANTDGSGNDTYVTLIAWKGMFSHIPAITSRDDIISATLKIYQRGPKGGEVIAVSRITTDWLLQEAGTNETIVTGMYKDGSSAFWAVGDATGFGSGDYTTEDEAQFTIVEEKYNRANLVEVTEMVKDMFGEGNYGFVLTLVSPYDSDPWFQNDERTDLGDDGYLANPTLYITYDDPNLYTLTVNSGTGDGNYFFGTLAPIDADPPVSGYLFREWIGDTSAVTNVNAASTNVNMPAANVTVTAAYDTIRTLTVNSGAGGGQYIEGQVVDIDADIPTSGGAPGLGVIFYQWIGDTAGIADVYADVTTITMPAGDAEITAEYTAATVRTLTVNAGTGGGSYWPHEIVPIAESPPTGEIFVEWIGDTAVIADIYAASTTVTMPDANVEVTATYEEGPTGAWVFFREGGGTGYVDVTFDDAWINAPHDPGDTPHGDSYLSFLRDQGYTDRVPIIAVKDLFDVLSPSTNGNAIQIHGAKLYVYLEHVEYGDGTKLLRTYRITEDWLPDEAGTNEIDVSGLHAEVSSATSWAGPGGVFDMDDVFDAGQIDQTVDAFTTDPPGKQNTFDITLAMQGIYGTGVNYGFCLFMTDPPGDPDYSQTQYYSSESGTADYRPAIRLDYSYVSAVQYSLTVNSGSGSGTYYEGNQVDIIADPGPSGWLFNEWVGDTEGIIDVGDPDTAIIMPASNVEITATYGPARVLTVNSGTGGGLYAAGAVIDIQADAPSTGLMFDAWIGDTAGIADVNADVTTITMPDADAEITATYVPLPTYALTVNSGTGSGTYWAGQVADIQGDTPAMDYVFEEWIGDTTYVGDIWAIATTFTMPGQAAEVTATYRYAPYLLTVDDGGGGGRYDASEVVLIFADAAGTGGVFDQWIGDTSCIADVSLACTTLTMPASDAVITASYMTDVPDGFRVQFREGGGTGYVDMTLDDTWLELDPIDNVEHGTEVAVSVVDGPTSGGDEPQQAGLVCFTDLFNELAPSSNAVNVTINRAYLVLYRYNGPRGTPFSIARVTTNWVPDEAGTNEIDVSGLYAESSTYTTWADFLTNFSNQDYDTTTEMPVAMRDGGYNAPQQYDVTGLVQDIYTSGNNYGFALIGEPDYFSPDLIYDEYWGINFRSSEHSTLDVHPTLIIDYQYGDLYTLTVTDGTGSGTYYENDVVPITADAPPTGCLWDDWEGDTAALDDPSQAATNVTMPAGDVQVTATYVCCTPPSGDLDDSGFVGQGDLDIVLDQWGNSGPEITDPRADPSGDSFVGQADLDIVLDDWGKSCEED